MTKPIDFYFDFSSPYGYLAAMRIDALAATYQREVKWHAILLGVVFQTTGSAPLSLIPIKGTYSIHDFQRSARFHGIAYKQPGNFPMAAHVAARAMLWLQNTRGDACGAAFAKATFQAYFVDGVDIGNSANLAHIAAQLGVDTSEFIEAIATPEIKAQLKAEVEQAMVRGVFGSPFFIVNGEPFWGFDRFEQIEATLKHGKI